MERYNGWKNYETWLFNLHYGDYLYESYQDLKKYNPDLDLDAVKFVENFIDSLFIDELPSSTPKLFLDIIRAYIERVDVEEIAEILLED